ncbi:hypothetical protein BGX34_007547 [Mortierella sp. NVP85]|nr:hypothetical protein BGX34_007547 [Mortierella sp. NVP85]
MVSQQSATAAASLTDVAAVWSTLRNTVLTFGGSRAPPAVRAGLDMKTLREYDPATKTWKTMVTSGTVPTPRLDHCAAASEDGSKIVVFGGSLDTKTYYQDIYILDVPTATWKRGPPATVPRTRMACGFHSGQFIAWGGSSADNRTTTMHNNIPLVYDTETDVWTTQYTFKGTKSDPPPPSSLPSSSPSSANGSSTPESNKNLGPVIGGAIAAIVALCGCALAIFIVYQRKKREKLGHYRDNDRMAASLTSEEDDYYRKGRGPPGGGGVQDYPDSDIERSTTGESEQHLRKMRGQDYQYAAAGAGAGAAATAADSLMGGPERYSGSSGDGSVMDTGRKYATPESYTA